MAWSRRISRCLYPRILVLKTVCRPHPLLHPNARQSMLAMELWDTKHQVSPTTLRMQLQPVFHCSSLNTLDPSSGRKSRRCAMVPAFGMVILPRILVLGMGRFQAGVQGILSVATRARKGAPHHSGKKGMDGRCISRLASCSTIHANHRSDLVLEHIGTRRLKLTPNCPFRTERMRQGGI